MRLWNAKCCYCGQRKADVEDRSVSTGPGHGRIMRCCAGCSVSQSWEAKMGITPQGLRTVGAHVRFVGEPRITDSRFGANAYGSVLSEDASGNRTPVICMHGGSAWLCLACAQSIATSPAAAAVAP